MRWFLFTALALIVATTTGCNTVRGVGKDIHDSAQQVQVWMEDSPENKAPVDTRSARSSPPRSAQW